MSDVAVAEGDAAKGEIVISPAVHDLIHNNNNEGECGCECMPSGYFKIRSSLDDMLCSVDFSNITPSNPALNPAPSTENILINQELQYELDVYTDVVDELMAGYKVVSPDLFEKFSNVVHRLTAAQQTNTAAGVSICRFHKCSYFIFF